MTKLASKLAIINHVGKSRLQQAVSKKVFTFEYTFQVHSRKLAQEEIDLANHIMVSPN